MRKFCEKNNAKISQKKAKILQKNKTKIPQTKIKTMRKNTKILRKIHSLIVMVERMYCGRTDRNLKR